MRKSYLYIIDVFPKKKEATLVFSDRRLFNLVPFEGETKSALLSFFKDYTIYEIDDKYFRNAVKPEPNSKSL